MTIGIGLVKLDDCDLSITLQILTCDPTVEQFRQVEMFTKVLTVEKRNQVLATFGDPATPLKLIICTSAFGMGVDIPDIRRVVQLSTIEEYVQESERDGVMAKIV